MNIHLNGRTITAHELLGRTVTCTVAKRVLRNEI
ncbi:hypothetical protein RSAG8_04151, partial [Rhizoctonia solani AG-8 WAC10335]